MSEKPKVRIPVTEVPWVSGTIADLECARRWRGTEYGEYHPRCCRWPKSCSAFDPGFTTGKGPTTLPMVWNDGYGWRSGPPKNLDHLPAHLREEIQCRWIEVARNASE